MTHRFFIACLLILVSPLNAAVHAGEVSAKTVLINASVTETSTLTVKLFKGAVDSSGNAAFDWSTDMSSMDFGTLSPVDSSNSRSPLCSSTIYMAYCVCVHNTGKQYYVKYDGAPLMLSDASASLPNDSWVVTVGAQTGDAYFNTTNTAGLMSGKISGADTEKTLFTSNSSGTTDVFRVYFAIVGLSAYAVNGSSSTLIPYSQKAGTYTASVKITMYN